MVGHRVRRWSGVIFGICLSGVFVTACSGADDIELWDAADGGLESGLLDAPGTDDTTRRDGASNDGSFIDGPIDGSTDGADDASDGSADGAPSDAADSCSSPLARCGLECIDPQTDPRNCGGGRRRVQSGQRVRAGRLRTRVSCRHPGLQRRMRGPRPRPDALRLLHERVRSGRVLRDRTLSCCAGGRRSMLVAAPRLRRRLCRSFERQRQLRILQFRVPGGPPMHGRDVRMHRRKKLLRGGQMRRYHDEFSSLRRMRRDMRNL